MSIFVGKNGAKLHNKPQIMDNEIKIKSLTMLEEVSADFSRLGDDCMFAHVLPGQKQRQMPARSIRFDGLAMLLCKSGSVKLDLNMHPATLRSGMMLIASSRSVINFVDIDAANFEAYLLILSTEFMRNVSIDLNTLSNRSGLISANNTSPMIELTPDEMAMTENYFKLFHANMLSNPDELYVKAIARTLMAAIIYQLMQFGARRSSEDNSQRPYSRKMNYVHDFIALVHKHFRSERSVHFYAEKLFISPKYLSLIIREATGRSASDWIDECVILEAKNLLRYSGKNVQQIAYELNFNNQSSFGKYFKHLTGMSPTRFQQS